MCNVSCNKPNHFPPPQPLSASQEAEGPKRSNPETTGDHVLQPFYEPNPWQPPKTLEDQRADTAGLLRSLREQQAGYFNGDMYSTAHEGVSLSGLRSRLAAAKQRLKNAPEADQPKLEHEIRRYEREINDRTEALADLEKDIAQARGRLQSIDRGRSGRQKRPGQGVGPRRPAGCEGVRLRR